MFLRSVFVNTWWKVKNVSELSLRELKVTNSFTDTARRFQLLCHKVIVVDACSSSALMSLPFSSFKSMDWRSACSPAAVRGVCAVRGVSLACVFINCALWAFYKVYRKPGRGRYGRGWGTVRQTCQCAREMHRPPRLGGMGSSAICELVFSAGTFCLCDLWICFM